MSMRIKKGDVVIRSIEGLDFEATVLEVDLSRRSVRLCYIDDGNIEDSVDFEDIQEIVEGKSNREFGNLSKNCRKGETLAKPLSGLVDDDHEVRNNHQPKVIIHDNCDADDSRAPIILNGAENRLAAGGGLRALRYLKK
jgi:hypothetical protein